MRFDQGSRTEPPILTIGHSSRTADEFTRLLQLHRVEFVADVRSVPYSRRFPQFSRGTIDTALMDEGIRYVFLGLELGARRDEPECYVGDTARYDLIRKATRFQQGIQRLLDGASRYRIALMCSEWDPLQCHRTILICRELRGLGTDIEHILTDTLTESHVEAEQRLMREEGITPNQLEMFDSSMDGTSGLERAYDARAEKIAFAKDRSNW